MNSPHEKIIIEICAFSLEAAIEAELGGADRIELCASPGEGGTTPATSLVETVLETVSIPVFPIVRPRGGDFCYSAQEFEMMRHDIELFARMGCKGITFSILLPDGSIDTVRTRELVDISGQMETTFIRGFDLTPDPFVALRNLQECGCRRVLTSGQAVKATDAAELIAQLVDCAGIEFSVMPGSGINSGNLAQMALVTGAREFHASARKLLPGSPKSSLLGFGDRISCDRTEVARMRQIANKF